MSVLYVVYTGEQGSAAMSIKSDTMIMIKESQSERLENEDARKESNQEKNRRLDILPPKRKERESTKRKWYLSCS